MLLIAAQPVQRFGQHNVEAASPPSLEQILEAGTIRGGAADGVIGVDLDNRPAFAVGAGSADPDLIVDGRLALVVGAVAGRRSRRAWSGPLVVRAARSRPGTDMPGWAP